MGAISMSMARVQERGMFRAAQMSQARVLVDVSCREGVGCGR